MVDKHREKVFIKALGAGRIVNGTPLNVVDQFTYLGSTVFSGASFHINLPPSVISARM